MPSNVLPLHSSQNSNVNNILPDFIAFAELLEVVAINFDLKGKLVNLTVEAYLSLFLGPFKCNLDFT